VGVNVIGVKIELDNYRDI